MINVFEKEFRKYNETRFQYGFYQTIECRKILLLKTMLYPSKLYEEYVIILVIANGKY